MLQRDSPLPVEVTVGDGQLTGAQAILVQEHLGLARAMARRYRNRGVELDDLEQVAMLALVRAARRFDPHNGAAFSTYAMTCILGELKRYFRDHAWAMRVPRRTQELYLRIKHANDLLRQQLGRSPTVPDLADELGVSEEQVLEALDAADNYHPARLDAPHDEEGPSLLDGLPGDGASQPEGVIDRVALEAYWPRLTARERRLLELIFFEERSQAAAGRRLDASQMQVSRMLERLIARLRQDLAAEG